MQNRLRDGYAYLARQDHVAVVPVGDAWSVALAQRPASPLWDSDGHYPSLEGPTWPLPRSVPPSTYSTHRTLTSPIPP